MRVLLQGWVVLVRMWVGGLVGGGGHKWSDRGVQHFMVTLAATVVFWQMKLCDVLLLLLLLCMQIASARYTHTRLSQSIRVKEATLPTFREALLDPPQQSLSLYL